MEFIAEEVREYLAELGFRSLDEAIGHSELLDVNGAVEHWKASGLDLAPILDGPAFAERRAAPQHPRRSSTSSRSTSTCRSSSARRTSSRTAARSRFDLPIRNTERAVGTMLGHHVTRRARRERPAVRIDRRQPHRIGRAVLRRVHARRHHAAPRGRLERLRRQGPLRRSDRHPPAARRRPSTPRRTSSPATSSATARRRARCSCAASWGSGSSSATPARPPSSRASATTRSST